MNTQPATQESQWDKWIGNSESRTDTLTAAPIAAMAATLDKAPMQISAGTVVPALWHWLYFLPAAAQSELAADGHPRKGDFLPPIDLPRRMWAGSRLQFHQALRVGESITRISTIKSIKLKRGRSGQLAFVCVGHQISGERGLSIYEEHDIVYRENAAANANPASTTSSSGKLAPAQAEFGKTISPDPVLLFRYSALTFNGHRIHYDRDYANKVEGYPGLVVHGPLLASLLVDLIVENLPDYNLGGFEFRAIQPVFDLNDFKVCGTRPDNDGVVKVWIQNHEGMLCMEATATGGGAQ